MRRRLGWALILLVVLAFAADRVAVKLAEGEVASRFQSQLGLDSKPHVSLGGFPFLTQVLAGKYRSLDADVDDMPIVGDTDIARVQVHLTNLHVPLKNLVNRQLDSIPVDAGTATGLISYQSLDAAANAHLRGSGLEVSFAPSQRGGNLLALTGTYSNGVVKTQITGDVAVDVQGNRLAFRVPGDAFGVPAVIRDQLVPLLETPYRLPAMPFSLQIRRFAPGPDGVSITASGKDLVVGRGGLG